MKLKTIIVHFGENGYEPSRYRLPSINTNSTP